MTKPNNAPKIELWAIGDIKPYDKNAKIHTENQIDSLVSVIRTQGWDVPIVVDKDGVVIKGHGRRLAALRMGLKEVPVIVRRDMSESEVKAARLSDNRVAMGDFDVEAIKDELESLRGDGFDLGNMGFDDKELQMMLGDFDAMDLEALKEPAATEPSISAPAASEPVDAPVSQSTVKAVLLSDMLGFKHVPGEYKNQLVEFQAMCETATGKQGADAFGAMIAELVKQGKS